MFCEKRTICFAVYSQVRTISEKFGLNLNAQIVCLSPSQWLNCFLEMLEVVPEKFHPS